MRKVCRAIFALMAVIVIGLHAAAHAHKPSDSYLKLAVSGEVIESEWHIALRDLDFAIGLDTDQDGAITWREVKATHPDIAAYALSRLTLGNAGAACAPAMQEHLIDDHSDGAYAVLRFRATCATAVNAITINYRLFFDLDPQHRGLLNLSADSGQHTGVLTAEVPQQQFALAVPSPVAQFIAYVKEGVTHIWRGADHILFLLSLLLPAVLMRGGRVAPRWVAAPGFRAVFWDVFKVVTAFTIAHSITLSLAALGAINLPSRLVESAIAASVVLAAVNNIFPVVDRSRWLIAFSFGLVHGVGIANVLTDLCLPQTSLLLSLVAFNAGVELGQLVIVALFLPLAFLLRDTRFYQRGVMVGGSAAVAVIATLLLFQRATNVVVLAAFGP